MMASPCEYYEAIDLVSIESEPTHQVGTLLSRLRTLSEQVVHLLGYSRTLEMFGVFVLVILMLTGYCMQVIALNFWLQRFPADRSPGNYTVLAVSSTIFSLFFLCIVAVHLAIHRPSLRFLCHARSWLRLVGIGVADLLNSVLAIYAASYTTEVLQALFVALVPIYTACLARFMLKDRRCYRSRLLVMSFALLLAGVGLTTVWMMIPNANAVSEDDALSRQHSDRSNEISRGGTNRETRHATAVLLARTDTLLELFHVNRSAGLVQRQRAIRHSPSQLNRRSEEAKRNATRPTSCGSGYVGKDVVHAPIRVLMRANTYGRVLTMSNREDTADRSGNARTMSTLPHREDGEAREPARQPSSSWRTWTLTSESGSADSSNTNNNIWWALIFFISVPMSVLMNIGQTIFMIRYVAPDENDSNDESDMDAQDVVVIDPADEIDDSTHSTRRWSSTGSQHEGQGDARRMHSSATTDVGTVNEGAAEHERSAACAGEDRSGGAEGERCAQLIECTATRIRASKTNNRCRGEDDAIRYALACEPVRDGEVRHSSRSSRRSNRARESHRVVRERTTNLQQSARRSARSIGSNDKKSNKADVVGNGEDGYGGECEQSRECDNSSASCNTSTAMLCAGPLSRDVYLGDDTTVKLVMLAAGTTVQCLGVLLLLPMDALPWFGRSESVSQAYRNFFDGVDCVLHCPHNLIFCGLYTLGFVLVYLCATYLNQYSVTLCSMVTQIASPTTALLLVVFPSLNVTIGDGADAPWYISLCSVVCLVGGAFMYTMWDVQTSDDKLDSEMRLRREMILHECGVDVMTEGTTPASE